MAILVLLRLAAYTGRKDFEQSAKKALSAFAHRMQAGSPGMPQMLVASLWAESAPTQIVLAGADVQALAQIVWKQFIPSRLVFGLNNEASIAYWTGLHPELNLMHPIDGKPAAFICKNFSCELPITSPAALEASLQ